MTLRVAIQMDHVSGIDIAGDTTFALGLEAQSRGYDLFHYVPKRLQLRGGTVSAAVERLELRDEPGDHFTLGDPVPTDLASMNVVLLRQDPPFDMAYISTTHMLERIHPGTLVVNDPVSVRNAPEKLLVMEFAELMPETLITRDLQAIADFRRDVGDIILKPLYGNGGAGVFLLTGSDRNFSSLLELFDGMFREPFIAQQYLPQVRKGDKRIILVDGEPVGAINRVPSENDARSNMHVGGKAEHTELTARDLEICEAIAPELRKRDFILVGIDVIGDFMTEINVTSPTGIREIRKFSGTDCAVLVWDAIQRRL